VITHQTIPATAKCTLCEALIHYDISPATPEWLRKGAPRRMICSACAEGQRKADETARDTEAEVARLGLSGGWLLEDFKADPARGLALVGVPSRYVRASLDSCPDLPANLVEHVREWAREPRDFVVLCGIPGSGKTHLAAAALREAVETAAVALGDSTFTTEAEYLRRLRASYDGERSGPDRLHEIKFLALDDLGSAGLTNWGRASITDLICARHAAELPTVITSNLTIGELGSAVDARVSSRLAEGGQVYATPRHDLRLQGREAATK